MQLLSFTLWVNRGPEKGNYAVKIFLKSQLLAKLQLESRGPLCWVILSQSRQLSYYRILHSPYCSHLLANISWATALYSGQQGTVVSRTWSLPLWAHYLVGKLRNEWTMPAEHTIQDKKTVLGLWVEAASEDSCQRWHQRMWRSLQEECSSQGLRGVLSQKESPGKRVN